MFVVFRGTPVQVVVKRSAASLLKKGVSIYKWWLNGGSLFNLSLGYAMTSITSVKEDLVRCYFTGSALCP